MTSTSSHFLIRAGRLITQNPERDVLEDAGIGITDGVIDEVGPYARLAARRPAAQVMDLSNMLVMPGLVNGHTHAPMSLFRGLADDLPLMEWLNDHIWPVERQLTPHMVHLGSMLSCAEMIRTGTTAFSDMYLLEQEVARAADESGMRAVVGEGVFSIPTLSYERIDQVWELIAELRERYRDHPRITTAVAAHAVYTTTPEALSQSFEEARSHGEIFSIHLAESSSETSACLAQFGLRPVAYLDSLGILNSRTVIYHGVDLTMGEIELLAERGVGVVHCPESNMKLASGIAPAEAMRRAGVRLGLGTDGAASNNNLSLFTEMGSAAMLQKVALSDPTAMPAGGVLDMATLGSASCLGLPRIGSIEPGKAADLIGLDLTSPGLRPLYHPVSQAVYSATGGEVAFSMVGGRVLYDHGRFTTFDYPALLDEIDSFRQWVLGRMPARS